MKRLAALLALLFVIGSQTSQAQTFLQAAACYLSGSNTVCLKTVNVASGGTGAATFTAHGVMLGEGTGALVPTAAGTNGQLLVGSTGADPAWGNAVSAATQFSGGYRGNIPNVYTFANLTGVTSVTNFADGTTRNAGTGITQGFAANTSTFTMAQSGSATYYLVTIEASAKFGGTVGATSGARIIITLSGTATRLNSSAFVGKADNKIEFNMYNNNGDDSSFTNTFYIETTAANQTLGVAATLEDTNGASSVTGGIAVSINAI